MKKQFSFALLSLFLLSQPSASCMQPNGERPQPKKVGDYCNEHNLFKSNEKSPLLINGQFLGLPPELWHKIGNNLMSKFRTA